MNNTFFKYSNFLLSTSAALLIPSLAFANNCQYFPASCPPAVHGSFAKNMPPPPLRGPFQISVTRENIGGVTPSKFQSTSVDEALNRASIHIKNDGLDIVPQLNVSAEHGSVTVIRSRGTRFTPFWNYGAFIRHAEVRIMAADQSVRSQNNIVLPVRNGYAVLPPHTNLPDELIYVLRVYDRFGQFDETKAKPLTMVHRPVAPHNTVGGVSALTGYGIDRTAVRNIRVRGATVTIHGDNVPKGGFAFINNTGVMVDPSGKFVAQMILPYGPQTVNVNIGAQNRIAAFRRVIHIDDSEFFYVALGDLTIGNQKNSGPTGFIARSDEDFDGDYAKGRAAMYLKGKWRGDYRITASVDTGEERLSDIFSNLDKKDPRQLLRRLDGDKFYPVYGDESTLIEDAPTQGKLYLRVDKDDSHVMFGNFITNITGSELAQLDRGLYGGIADLKSTELTRFGDRRTHITAFAADPGTIPARNEFRGSGGSLYFLDRQDITIGSDRLRVEVRDKVSGLVIETRDLHAQKDYEIDYIQGRIVLSQPLQSTQSDGQTVRSGTLSGNDVYLVARYEYTPTLTDISGYTIGGRATHWLGNHLRLGVTAQSEETDAADQNLIGVDVLLQKSDNSYIKAELAQTEGPGFGQNNSADGGFNFNQVNTPGTQGTKAQAYRVEAAVDLSEISYLRGSSNVYYDHQDAGYSGTGRFANTEIDRMGGQIKAALSAATDVAIKYDEVKTAAQDITRAVYGEITHAFNRALSVSLGVRHDQREVTSTGLSTGSRGARSDASIQIDYRGPSNSGFYIFGQTTFFHDVSRNTNDRLGIGGQFQFTDKVKVSGEISDGDTGLGASLQATYTRSDTSEFYLGYALSPDHREIGLGTQTQISDGGTITFGTRTRYSDALSVFGEERIVLGRTQTAYTHAYGLNYNPNDVWSFGASIENGTIEDVALGNFERTAFTLSAGRVSDLWRFASSLEGRFEEGFLNGNLRDRTTWLMRNTAALQASRDWEVLARYNFAISESDQSNLLNAEFKEGILGLAYRPVHNDRLNALLKYTYFENLAPQLQISGGGGTNTVRQRTQIVSIDTVYDLSNKLSLGFKYGYRNGEVAFDRTSDAFINSAAHLAIMRLDYHLIHEWDVLLEARLLSSRLSQDEQYGALVGVYRHVGKNAKIGIGYNFTELSDDLTDFNHNSKGYFINLVSKF